MLFLAGGTETLESGAQKALCSYVKPPGLGEGLGVLLRASPPRPTPGLAQAALTQKRTDRWQTLPLGTCSTAVCSTINYFLAFPA